MSNPSPMVTGIAPGEVKAASALAIIGTDTSLR